MAEGALPYYYQQAGNLIASEMIYLASVLIRIRIDNSVTTYRHVRPGNVSKAKHNAGSAAATVLLGSGEKTPRRHGAEPEANFVITEQRGEES